MASLCLTMMVRNEAHILARSIGSVLPFLDSWSITDTGSTDGTPEIIRDLLGNLPGTLHEVPWRDFGWNRTQAVALARAHLRADYLLVLDADLAFGSDLPPEALKPMLSADGYDLRYAGPLDYTNTRLLSTRHLWTYVGVTHEYVFSPTASSFAELPGVRLIDFGDGANRADKFERDIRLLTQDLERDPANPRSVFYLAQSHKDLGQWGEALFWYEKRSGMAGFDEETWYATLMLALMMERVGVRTSQVAEHLLRAYALRPSRIEPIYHLARIYRETGQPAMAFTFAAVWGHGIPYPTDRLFIDRLVYEVHLPYEFMEAAGATGRHTLAEKARQYLLHHASTPGWMIRNLGG